MQQTQQRPDDFLADMRNAFGWLTFVCRSLAVSVEVFLHSHIGSRYMGLPALGALLIIVLFPAGWPDADPRPTLYFAGAYLLLSFCARLDAASRCRKRIAEHSCYTGRPILLRWFPKADELQIKRTVEPILVMVVGILIRLLNEPLGTYLVLAGLGLAASVAINELQHRTRLMDIQDAVIDQRTIAEELRRGDDE